MTAQKHTARSPKFDKGRTIADGGVPNSIVIDGTTRTLAVIPKQPETKKREYVKAGLHAELQKFGEKPKPSQGSLFERLDQATQDQVAEYKINVVGIDASLAQNKALFAIQNLLTVTDYKGNTRGQEITKHNAFGYKGYLPSLRMTLPEFLDAYGVTKRTTPRGKEEYLTNERDEAVQALRDLNTKNYLFYYERVYRDEKNKEIRDVIRAIRPLIHITEGWKGLTEAEADTVKGGGNLTEKLTHIALEPCPILVDQINNYFVLKPANMYQEVKLLYGKKDKKLYLFLEWLVVKQKLKKGDKKDQIIEIGLKTLSHTLKNQYLIETSQYPRLRKNLIGYFDKAKELGYLKEYRIEQGVDGEKAVFVLNEEKYYKVKKIEEDNAREGLTK